MVSQCVYMNSLLNEYIITKYLTSLLFAIITYLLLLFVLIIDHLSTTQKLLLNRNTWNHITVQIVLRKVI